jgi:hypothetical protein
VALSAKSIKKLLKIEPSWVKMAAKGTYKSPYWSKTIRIITNYGFCHEPTGV